MLPFARYGGRFRLQQPLYESWLQKLGVGRLRSPYQEFQRFKMHPRVKALLEGGSCISYGARCLNEGGLQAVPKLTFPGGMLTGCSAGFLNVPKIKGSHTAMKTGMLAGECAADAVLGDARQVEVTKYEEAVRSSWVWEELERVRNFKPAWHLGMLPGLGYGGMTLMGRGKDLDLFRENHLTHRSRGHFAGPRRTANTPDLPRCPPCFKKSGL